MSELIGQTLGNYRIVDQIGMGGMATVYKAYQANMDRYVAIKVLPRQFAEDPSFIGRFEQEARTIAKLEHKHILPVYDYGEQDGYTYLVMRYVGAGNLKDLITQGPLPLPDTVAYLTQIAGALQHAHNHGVIHRDVKTSNVLIDQERQAYLMDFGIAKLVAGTAQFTGTGTLVGTPAYMSPEQCSGTPVDARSDIYSLGIVLYEMVTGVVPYQAETPIAVVLKHIQEPLPSPRKLNPALPESVERVIFRALAKDANARFQSANDLAVALRQAIDTSADTQGKAAAITAPPERTYAAVSPPAPLHKRHIGRARWWWLVGLLAVAVIAVVGVGLLLQDQGDEDGEQAPTGGTGQAVAGIATDASPAESGIAGETGETPAEVTTGQEAEPGWTIFTSTTGDDMHNRQLVTGRAGLWMSSEGGLVYWQPDGTAAKYTTADGLPYHTLYAMAMDAAGDLWLSAGSGHEGVIRLHIGSSQPGQYQAHVTLSVTPPNPDRSQADAALVETDEILKAALEAGNFPVSSEELAAALQVVVIPDTSLLKISVTYDDPVLAADMANQVAEQLVLNSPGNLTPEQQNQIDLASAEIDRLNAELSRYRQQLDAVDAQLETETDPDTIEQLRSERDRVVGQINETSSTIAQLTATIADLQQDIDSLTIVERARIPDASIGGPDDAITQIDYYTPDNSDLQSSDVWALWPEPDGTLLAGTYGTLLEWWAGDVWHIPPFPTTGSALENIGDRLWAVRRTQDGTLWAGGPFGLAREHDDTWEIVPLPDEVMATETETTDVHALFEDPADGSLWIAVQTTPNYDNFTLHLVPPNDTSGDWAWKPVPEWVPEVLHSLLRASDGTLWLVGFDVVAQLDGETGEHTIHGNAQGIAGEVYRDIVEAADGTIWLSTDRALVEFTGQRWLSYYTENEPPSSMMIALAETGDGTLWFVGRDGQVATYDEGTWTSVEDFDMAATDLALQGDTVWVATEEGLIRMDQGSTRTYTTADGLASDVILTLAFDPNQPDILWIGTEDGLARLDTADDTISIWSHDAQGLPGPAVYALHFDPSGELWIGTGYEDEAGKPGDVALLRFGEGDWTVVASREDTHFGEDDRRVLALADDGQGGLWVGTNDGLAHYTDGGGWQHLTGEDGTPGGGAGITSMVVDGDVLWLTTDYDGLYRMDAFGWYRFGRAEIGTENLHRLYRTSDGALWVLTTEGIARLVGDPLAVE